MGAIKDTYDIIKDLLSEAKKLKKFEFVEMVLEIQQRFFDLNSENQEMKSKINEQEKILEQLPSLHKQMEVIIKENQILKDNLSKFEANDDLSFLDQNISLKYTEMHYVYTSNMPPSIVNTVNETLKEIYLSIAPELLTPKDDVEFETLFQKTVNGTFSYLDGATIGKIKAKFLQHQLIEIKDLSNGSIKIQLTDFGKQVLNKLNDL